MKHRNLFMGGLLVILGALFILKNIGVVYFNWMSIFSLWPMIFILLGVSILPIKDSIKSITTVILLFVTVAMIFSKTNQWTHNYSFNWNQWEEWDEWDTERYSERESRYETSEQYFYEPYDTEIKEATLTIDAVAGEFIVKRKSNYLMEFNQDGNVGPYIYSTTKTDDHQSLTFDIKNRHFKTRRLNNEVEIQLNPKPIWNININAGAASVELDLTRFKMKTVDIDGGASAVYLRLGNTYKKTKIYINAGVSSIEIYIPEDVGCEIDTDTFLASRRFDDFEKIRRGLYKTSNFEESNNKIYISINAAITSLEVVRY